MENKYIKKYNIEFLISCVLPDVNGIWGVSGMYPFLFFYHYKKGIIFSRVIPNCNTVQQLFMFQGIYKNDCYVFLIPNNESDIVVYNIKTDSFTRIALKDPCPNMFRGCVCIKDDLICIPFRYDYYVSIDVQTLKVKYICQWKCNDYDYTNGYTVKGNNIYTVMPKSNKVFCYDIEKGKAIIKEVGDKDSSYTSICGSNENVILYDNHRKSINVLDSSLEKICKSMIIDKEAVALHSGYSGDIIVDDVLTDEWDVFSKELMVIKKDDYEGNNINESREGMTLYKFGCWFNNYNEKVCCVDKYNHLYEFNRDMSYTCREISMSAEMWRDIIDTNYKTNCPQKLYKENQFWKLTEFLNLIELREDLNHSRS